jgi:lysozyme family protein
MAKGNLPACLHETLKYEGGYQEDRRDPGNKDGGATNMGITSETLALNWGRAVTKQDVRDLTRGEATEIYEARYWRPVRGDELPYGLDLSTFDAGVNSGTSRGIKWLQAAVGETVDGRFGPMTMAAVNAITDMPRAINALNDKRIGFMRSLRIWSTFGKGWSRRVASVRAKSVAMWMAGAGVSMQSRRDVLAAEADKATKTTARQAQGAGGAGAGGGGLSLWDMAQGGGWLTAALLALTAVGVAVLIIRALVNRDRANAFNDEVNKLEEVK